MLHKGAPVYFAPPPSLDLFSKLAAKGTRARIDMRSNPADLLLDVLTDDPESFSRNLSKEDRGVSKKQRVLEFLYIKNYFPRHPWYFMTVRNLLTCFLHF